MNDINKHFQSIVLQSTGANEITSTSVIQSLWSGYGQIIRCELQGSDLKSVVVKHVNFPTTKKHPRGWNSDLGHQRKVRSYEVEMEWYQHYANKCDDSCKVPNCLAFEQHKDEVFMVLEDLNESGFPKRLTKVEWNHITICLKWLASFHATFLNIEPEGIWPVGTYWHLDTRPDELDALDDTQLKKSAHKIDQVLSNVKYKTLVHGDAKLANFCFSKDGRHVSAVDFQYVGGGCGMKDVAYFIGSCLYEDECESLEKEILNIYFVALKKALIKHGKANIFPEIEKEWRDLYHVAWTDFHRFLKGWSPDHWKINSYSEKLVQKVIEYLNT